MLQLKTYSLPEIKDELHISKRMWEERKEEVLEWMKLFFNYEITTNGRSYAFIIKEQYGEYEPLPRKGQGSKIKEFYANETDHILKYKSRNTGSNIAREITSHNNIYNHRFETAVQYIRPYLKENYSIEDRQWCKINYEHFCYNIMPKEELKYLKSLFSKYLNSETTANIIAETEAGYQTQEECYNKLKYNYDSAMREFKDKYGYRPYKAGELRKKIEMA